MISLEPFPLRGKAARRAQHAPPMEVVGEKSPAFGGVTLPPLRGRNVS
jgi:hypothetical protein